MIVFFIAAEAVGAFLAIWGSQTRGTLSPVVGSVGGMICIVGTVLGFLNLGVTQGLLILVSSIIFAAFLMRVLPKRV